MTNINVNSPFTRTTKTQNEQEVRAVAAFQTIEKNLLQGDKPLDQQTMTRDQLETYAAGALGVDKAAVDEALSHTDAQTFDVNSFSALVGGLAPASGQAGPADDGKVLARGANNDPEAVKLLQAQLHARGLYDGPVDGKFGKGTEDALKAYQISMHHVGPDGQPDGKAGPVTRAALAQEASAQQAVKSIDDKAEFDATHQPTQQQKDATTITDVVTDNTNKPTDVPPPDEGVVDQEKQAVITEIQIEQGADSIPAQLDKLAPMPTNGNQADIDAANLQRMNLLTAALKKTQPGSPEASAIARVMLENTMRPLGLNGIYRLSDAGNEQGLKDFRTAIETIGQWKCDAGVNAQYLDDFHGALNMALP